VLPSTADRWVRGALGFLQLHRHPHQAKALVNDRPNGSVTTTRRAVGACRMVHGMLMDRGDEFFIQPAVDIGQKPVGSCCRQLPCLPASAWATASQGERANGKLQEAHAAAAAAATPTLPQGGGAWSDEELAYHDWHRAFEVSMPPPLSPPIPPSSLL